MPDSEKAQEKGFCLPTSLLPIMPTSRFEPSLIKNKIKRDEVVRKSKKAKGQLKLQRRLALVKQEANDPAAKKVRQYYSFSKTDEPSPETS